MPTRTLWTRKRLTIAAAALLLLLSLLAGGWCWASPWWTLRQMQAAARAGDVPRFASYTDSAAIEAEALRDAQRMWGAILETVRPDTGGNRRFRAFAERNLAAQASATRVAPRQIMPWFAELPVRFPGLDGGVGRDPHLARDGLDRFEIRYGDSDSDYAPLLTFRREGLGWRLDGVRWGQQ